MEPLYEPQGVEERWQQTWEGERLYHADPAAPGETYVIAVPPPNVTGALHMGHALNGSIQDVLIRRHRMSGFNTLWQPGYDHAGIATQAVVEKELRRQGTSRQEIGREAVVEGSVTIATVRPATMLADVAVAVHPGDERYAHLIGKEVLVPVVNRAVPVIADERVEPEFGTGALKITPGHDPTDFEIGRDRGLPELTVIGFDGRMTGDIPDEYVGLTEEEAEERVVAWLREHDLLEKRESYRHSVGHCE